MKTINDKLRADAERWLLEVGMPILAKKKRTPKQVYLKKEFDRCEAQYLQVGDRIKFGRYLNSKTWVVQKVERVVFHPISPCVEFVIVACRDPRKKSISQFSLPAERLIIREIKV